MILYDSIGYSQPMLYGPYGTESVTAPRPGPARGPGLRSGSIGDRLQTCVRTTRPWPAALAGCSLNHSGFSSPIPISFHSKPPLGLFPPSVCGPIICEYLPEPVLNLRIRLHNVGRSGAIWHNRCLSSIIRVVQANFFNPGLHLTTFSRGPPSS